MPGEIFYWIFNMSISATICAVPVLLIRLSKRMPRSIFIWLWIIPYIRMCVPAGISSQYGLMALLSRFATKTVTVYNVCHDFKLSATNHMMFANTYFPITYKVNILEDIFNIAFFVWILVALAAVLALIIIYFATAIELKSARRLRENIYISDKVRAPGVYGIFKPRIILPCGYKDEAMHYILLHENAHIKRKDNAVRAIALFITCIHWFNPAAWIFLRLLYLDMELACDEAVLSKCTSKQMKEYAHLLVSFAESDGELFAPSFGGASVRVRVKNLLSYRKLSIMSLVGFSVLLLAIAYMLLTNA